MIIHVYAVLDTVVGAFNQPFFARSEGEALRMIRSAVNSPGSGFHENPGDYQLVNLGTYDDSTGVIDAHSPLSVVNLSSLAAEITLPR